MRREVLLPLYGRISLDRPEWDLAWDLLQTERVQRLHDISLSSTPARYVAAGMPASRFQHSLGVMLVAARMIAGRPQWQRWRGELLAAALCHDLASPPTSHVAEVLWAAKSGRTHEQEAALLVACDPEIGAVLERYEVDAELVGQAFTGQHPVLGPLIAGDLDADSIDNSLHLLQALSGLHGSRMNYDPSAIAELFEPDEEERPRLRLDYQGLAQLLAWRQVRIDLYEILATEAQLSVTTTLLRAFSLSSELLTTEWFELGEHEALQRMEREGSPETRSLLRRLGAWKHLHMVAHAERSEPGSEGFAALPGDIELRTAVEDHVAGELGLGRDELALYAGYSRKTKQLRLPMVGEAAPAAAEIFGSGQPKLFRVAVFCPGSYKLEAGRVMDQVEDAVARLGSGRAPRKTFF